MPSPKSAAREKLESIRPALVDLSHRIHARPELGFEEEHASAWLSKLLDRHGFRVEKGVAGLPTAFVAHAGSGPTRIGICAEYDCLPGIGHACGHNLIAAMSAGAARVSERYDRLPHGRGSINAALQADSPASGATPPLEPRASASGTTDSLTVAAP